MTNAHKTRLSVNVNKIALLRNSRGRDYPSVLGFAEKFIALGVNGITIHPRPDERHVRRIDARDLSAMLKKHPHIEFNIEGYPDETFLQLIEEVRPHQCTLVPDDPSQITSDHGWDLARDLDFATKVVARIQAAGVRTSLFLDPYLDHVELAAKTGTNRIELHTESYARLHNTPESAAELERFKSAASKAQSLGLGVNAGHDLNLVNLPDFLKVDGILEVSIGHALVVECLEQGMASVIGQYLAICGRGQN